MVILIRRDLNMSSNIYEQTLAMLYEQLATMVKTKNIKHQYKIIKWIEFVECRITAEKESA